MSRSLWLSTAWLVQIIAVTALAEEHPPDLHAAQDRPLVVFVSPEGGAAAEESALRAMRASITDLSISVAEVRLQGECDEAAAGRVATEKNAVAVIWNIDRNAKRQLYFYMRGDSGYTVEERTLDGSNETFVVLAQAEIVRGWVSAMLLPNNDGHQSETMLPEKENDAGIGPKSDIRESAKVHVEKHWDASKKKTGTRSAVETEDKQDRLIAEVGYTLSTQSSAHPAVHGVGFMLGARVVKKLHLFLGYLFTFPTRDVKAGVTLSLRPHPIWLGARISHVLSRFELGAQAALCLDYVSVRIETSGDTIETRGNGGALQIAIVPMVTTALSIIGPFRLFVSLGADILLYQPRYLSKINGENIEMHLAWPVQPRILFGLSVRLL